MHLRGKVSSYNFLMQLLQHHGQTGMLVVWKIHCVLPTSSSELLFSGIETATNSEIVHEALLVDQSFVYGSNVGRHERLLV